MKTGAVAPFVVGVISDTHGRLPESVDAAFAGVDAIVHAGDVGDDSILDVLRTIAPVTAVRGNCDSRGEAAGLPSSANVLLGGIRFLVAHELRGLLQSIDPVRAGVRVVVTGHSHRALARQSGGVLYLNPGSASQGRGCASSVAIVTVYPDGTVEPRITELT